MPQFQGTASQEERGSSATFLRLEVAVIPFGCAEAVVAQFRPMRGERSRQQKPTLRPDTKDRPEFQQVTGPCRGPQRDPDPDGESQATHCNRDLEDSASH